MCARASCPNPTSLSRAARAHSYSCICKPCRKADDVEIFPAGYATPHRALLVVSRAARRGGSCLGLPGRPQPNLAEPRLNCRRPTTARQECWQQSKCTTASLGDTGAGTPRVGRGVGPRGEIVPSSSIRVDDDEERARAPRPAPRYCAQCRSGGASQPRSRDVKPASSVPVHPAWRAHRDGGCPHPQAAHRLAPRVCTKSALDLKRSAMGRGRPGPARESIPRDGRGAWDLYPRYPI